MIGVVVAGHGIWPRAMKQSVELICGDQKNISIVEINDIETADKIKEKISCAVEELDDCETKVILLDLFGGSPSHAVVSLNNENILAITGANLPMLLELVNINDSMELNVLSKKIIEIGRFGIRDIFKELNSML